jgi:hypothetical protein
VFSGDESTASFQHLRASFAIGKNHSHTAKPTETHKKILPGWLLLHIIGLTRTRRSTQATITAAYILDLKELSYIKCRIQATRPIATTMIHQSQSTNAQSHLCISQLLNLPAHSGYQTLPAVFDKESSRSTKEFYGLASLLPKQSR